MLYGFFAILSKSVSAFRGDFTRILSELVRDASSSANLVHIVAGVLLLLARFRLGLGRLSH